MKIMIWASLIGLLASGLFFAARAADQKTPAERRADADAAFAHGNFNDAYKLYRELALNLDDSPEHVSHDLTQGLTALQRLGRSDEIDDFREKAVAAHAGNWRLLTAAAKSFSENGEDFGYLIAGQFYRGNHRGNDGRVVYCLARDRVRALQLLQNALELAAADPNKTDVSDYYFTLADLLLQTRGNGAWQLAALTDLSVLPDYETIYPYRYYGGETRGAPVGPDGAPVYHHLPKSWKEAANDGERWRWALQQAAALSPTAAHRATFELAGFLQSQFGVQTTADYGLSGPIDADEIRRDQTSPFAVTTLGDDETICRLATGIKRLKLPEEFNFIHLYQSLTEVKDSWGEKALDALAMLFTNRRQYDRAADYWKKSLDGFGDKHDEKRHAIDQILGNWASFDTMETQPGGADATAWLNFRNGKQIHFTATEIDIPRLLSDVKDYLKRRPHNSDYNSLSIDNIGYRLVEQNQKQYLKEKVAEWDMDLTPPEKHFNARVKVNIPVKKAGAYLISGTMRDGNQTRIVLWHSDTAIVKKVINDGAYYYVADAATGKGLEKVNLEFFGYQNQWRDGVINTEFKNFAEFTDSKGQLTRSTARQSAGYSWVITARTEDGRFAWLGYTSIWGANYDQANFDERKVYFISDRPVYRPGNDVKFKFWVGQARYDKDGNSPYAGNSFVVVINNPRGEKVMEKNFTADEFGGFDGEFSIPKDATPGVYSAGIKTPVNQIPYGGGEFRVEEYKKPEYEVTVSAPDKPVMLGEKVSAAIKAKYYFGAPVAHGKVKYKITRTAYSADWYPAARWDWFYAPGYWWFSPDYLWYPGFEKWGCLRPVPLWMNSRFSRPEIVAENEVDLPADGVVKVEIDTAVAKAVHGDSDHKYQITAEVTDESRRTIVGQGDVLVARNPFKVFAWVDRGYYQTGDAIVSSFKAQTLDNKPVKGNGVLRLLSVAYKEGKPVETEVQHWDLNTDEQGEARQQLKADRAGQFRLSYTVTDADGHSIEGGYLLNIREAGFDGKDFRFNDVELITDRKEYQAGDTVRLMINASRPGATLLLFLRPVNGIYLPPKILHLQGKSTVEEIGVVKKDMPNFFIEAMTIADGKVRQEVREIVVPPESKVVNVELTPSAEQFRPGQKAKMKFRLSGADGAPVAGSIVLSLYDKSVEYISGGSNVPEIKGFFWKWRRSHRPQTESNLDRESMALSHSGERVMSTLGVFGDMMQDLRQRGEWGFGMQGVGNGKGAYRRAGAPQMALAADKPMDSLKREEQQTGQAAEAPAAAAGEGGAHALVQPTLRKNFADTAFWSAHLTSSADGTGEVEMTLPESLTTWKARLWTMSSGTRVGEGSAQIVTNKDLIVRLQAPRFFVQTDQVVLSANVHNYLKTAKQVKVTLDADAALLSPADDSAGATQLVDIPAGGEKRVDWRMQVKGPGLAVVRASALTDEESDAVELSFPSYVHGMLKTESFSGALRPADHEASLSFVVPKERLTEQSRVEIRYSPSVATAMVDALPYLADYPYGCTEQTLNRFLPTVITQKVLLEMKLDLADIQKKRTNLNAQEIGDDAKRAADWQRNNPPNPGEGTRNPVFDSAAVVDMTKAGLDRLTAMQNGDGGWGWFSGFGEASYPHTTAVVVHGLQIAAANQVAIVPGVLDRGVDWLKRYQASQVTQIKNAAAKVRQWKEHADDLDAFVYMVLTDAKAGGDDMKEMDAFLYRDRNFIGVYSKAMYGLALSRQNEKEKLDMILQNISQYLVQDNENQTAYLKLPETSPWWYWYGSDVEAMSYYLKLLARTDPKGDTAARLAKYLINNRKHASYWNSTRDTALAVEALADFIRASGENKPDMTVAISLDGKKVKEVRIDPSNLFSFDNKFVIAGPAVTDGSHKLTFSRTGDGPLYFNAYVTNFTLENPIKKAGLEIKVARQFYKLVEAKKTSMSQGTLGQVVNEKVEKYDRQPLADGATLKSGDLVEVEMEIDSKNDYEYLLFEDMKASGFEPVELRSGYNGNDLNAYMELHDERVCFFARALARGKHSVSYRLRAEIPGKFSALPTKASAMYAPELKANSDEGKLQIVD